MSTRCAVCYKEENKNEFTGIYSHWDGYPDGVGKKIWEILHKDFIGNNGELGIANNGEPANAIRTFIDIYIKGHPSGWSAFGEKCYCHNPAFVLRDGLRKSKITNEDFFSKNSWLDYAYVLNPIDKTMKIYARGLKKPLATIDLLGEEPDWEKIGS